MTLLLLAVAAAAGADADSLLAETRSRARAGDFDGAAITAQQAAAIPGDHTRQARYLLAIAHEYGGRPEQALGIYDALLVDWPHEVSADDVRYRRAETLGRLGRWREAQQALAALGEAVDRPPGDRVKILTLQGLWDIERGRERRGLRTLSATLATAEPDHSPFYQGKARVRLAELAVAAADQLVFRGTDRRKATTLEERAAYVQLAKDQLEAVIDLDEVTHVLPVLHQVGLAHEQFAEAMLAEPPIRRLSDEAQAVYDAKIAERAAALLIKALRYYEKALEYAGAMGWTGEPVGALSNGADRVRARIETID